MKRQNRQFTKFISLLKFPGLQYMAYGPRGRFENQAVPENLTWSY